MQTLCPEILAENLKGWYQMEIKLQTACLVLSVVHSNKQVEEGMTLQDNLKA
jgi:hypothetical protein